MLTTLTPTPISLLTRRARPVFTARWITTRPPSRPRQRSRWLPAAALDVGAVVPAPQAEPDPRRTLSPPDWTADSLCSQMPVDDSDPLFFGIEHRESPGALIAAANVARAICELCPVAAVCLTYALDNDERYGVWGGTSGRQREKMRQRMAAGTTVDELVVEHLTSLELIAPSMVQELTA